MYLEHISWLESLNIYSIIIRILLALLLGGLLGIEREQKQHPAGFRTYIIVCVGAALACITNIYMCEYLGSSDVARIPAQVISGMGFLGAGTILVTRNNHVKGLTTAAGLWCAATLGIAAGSGFYSGAIICGIVIVFSLRILAFVDKKFRKFNRYITIYAEYETTDFVQSMITYAKCHQYDIQNLELYPRKDQIYGSVTFRLKITSDAVRQDVIEELRNMDKVIFLEELTN